MRTSLLLFSLVPTLAFAQVPADLERERADFAGWIANALNSPLAARAVVAVGTGIRIGPEDSDVPFPGVDARVTEQRGALTLTIARNDRVLPRYRPVTAGELTVMAQGQPGRSLLIVFGGSRRSKTPFYYPYNNAAVFTGGLQPGTHNTVRVLTLEGVEVDATEAGTVTVPDGTGSIKLRVYRIPEPGTEESELMIFFRDGTSDKGSYPAGRFVTLLPLPDGRYRLDLNRARNPFCAYNSTYPCPAPWPGNTFTSAIEAGERYQSSAGSHE
jgi:uncharacterized protein (DUF1684 family)